MADETTRLLLDEDDLDALLTHIQYGGVTVTTTPLISDERLRGLFGLLGEPFGYVLPANGVHEWEFVGFNSAPLDKLAKLRQRKAILVTGKAVLRRVKTTQLVSLKPGEMEKLLVRFHHGDRSVITTPLIAVDRLRDALGMERLPVAPEFARCEHGGGFDWDDERYRLAHMAGKDVGISSE